MNKKTIWFSFGALFIFASCAFFLARHIENPDIHSKFAVASSSDEEGLRAAADGAITRTNEKPPISSAHSDSSSRTAITTLTDGGNVSSYNSARTNTKYLPIERGLMHGQSMDAASARNYLQSKRFDSFMRAFQKEMSGDPLASDLANTYSTAMKGQFNASENQLKLQDFACGLTLCMGNVISSDQAAYDKWVNAFGSNKSTPNFSYSDYEVDDGDGVIEHRFIFSTDPKSRSIYLPSQPGH
ncbi:MAG: hypothetical protein JSR26_00685 [Proteobacteria bacterium]|nr:hypothetical protein [Pseudomonadota bacterium]